VNYFINAVFFLDKKGYTPAEVLVGVVLADAADLEGKCWMTVERIRWFTGLGERAVFRALASWKKRGALNITKRWSNGRQIASEYQLRLQPIKNTRGEIASLIACQKDSLCELIDCQKRQKIDVIGCIKGTPLEPTPESNPKCVSPPAPAQATSEHTRCNDFGNYDPKTTWCQRCHFHFRKECLALSKKNSPPKLSEYSDDDLQEAKRHYDDWRADGRPSVQFRWNGFGKYDLEAEWKSRQIM